MLEQLLKMHAEKIRVNSNSDEYQKVMKQSRKALAIDYHAL